MPRTAKELTALAVEKLRKKGDGLYAVGGVVGLYIQISGDSRSWILRANTAGRRRDIGIGSYEQVSLAGAREKARELHKQIKDGLNPIEERRKEKANAQLVAAKIKTFRECANAFIEAKTAGWAVSHVSRVAGSLELHVFPIIGNFPVGGIDTGLVLEVLQQPVETADGKKPFWEAKPETAGKVRGRIESVLQWAKVRGLRTGDNPADWRTLKYTLPAKSAIYTEEPFPALPYGEVGAFMEGLRKVKGMSARALEFAILTAARSSEVRGAIWQEVDMAARTWTIPAVRMKAKKEHRVPLSDYAMKLLESLPRREGNDHIFPPERADGLSDMALLMVIRRMHKKKLLIDGKGWVDPMQNNKTITMHGFRSTFKDWAEEETPFQSKTVEFALAHKLPDKVEGAYQRGSLLEKRRRLMEAWAQYCDTADPAKMDNVIPMPAAE